MKIDNTTKFYILVIVVLFTWVTYQSCSVINEIEANKAYTYGIVVSKKFGTKSTVDYEFEVDGVKYKGNSLYYIGFAYPQVGDTFFVKYSSRDPSYSTMVVTQEDTKNNNKKKYKVLNYYNGDWPKEEREKRGWR